MEITINMFLVTHYHGIINFIIRRMYYIICRNLENILLLYNSKLIKFQYCLNVYFIR